MLGGLQPVVSEPEVLIYKEDTHTTTLSKAHVNKGNSPEGRCRITLPPLPAFLVKYARSGDRRPPPVRFGTFPARLGTPGWPVRAGLVALRAVWYYPVIFDTLGAQTTNSGHSGTRLVVWQARVGRGMC